ncbi:MAG: RlmE family RNA methyltransferase [bacterium]|nr:RlmE family RNA methyltransferase [bacterium]MDA1292670.1 RlmE family RNA methyltransferase [bacterium]
MPKRYTPNDKWSQKAAAEGYRARSVYKLMEIDDRFRLLKPGMTVLDLGAAPGSWCQYASEKVRNTKGEGRVIGIDLTEIEPIEGVETHVVDIKDTDALEKILPQYVGLIISDLAPKTSGIQDVDQWKSIELSQVVLDIARKHLKPNGKCVLKILRGADFDAFIRECKKEWETVKTFEARASRDRSKEIYVIIQM